MNKMDPTPASAEPAPFFKLPSSREEGQGWWVKHRGGSGVVGLTFVTRSNVYDQTVTVSNSWARECRPSAILRVC